MEGGREGERGGGGGEESALVTHPYECVRAYMQSRECVQHKAVLQRQGC